MLYVSVDVESDGPCPGLYSMISVGCVVVEPALDRTYYAEIAPISAIWVPEALAVSGFTRAQTIMHRNATEQIPKFLHWCESLNDRLMFVSDNNGFDWQFVNYYFHRYCGKNPFGHSSMNMGSLYKGLERNMFKNFKHLRRTKHTHNALDDAKGNAEAMLTIKSTYKI